MDQFLTFSYDVFGMPKVAAVVIIFVSSVLKIAKNRMDRAKQENSGRISEMLRELEKHAEPRYHFVIEQVFQNRYGTLIDYPIIKFFLKSKTPSADIIKYVLGRRYIAFSDAFDSLSYKRVVNQKKVKSEKMGAFLHVFPGLFYGNGDVCWSTERSF